MATTEGAGAKGAGAKARKVNAAKREKANGKVAAPTVEALGRVYTLPAEMPPSIVLQMPRLQRAETTGDPIPLLALIERIIGEDQYSALAVDLDDADAEKIGTVIAETVAGIFEAYGTTAGESQASRKS